jgi:acyl-CoA synthetase (AMP-forming)/AMP-acid ligase II
MPETSAQYQPGLTMPDLIRRAARNVPGKGIGFYDKNGSVTLQTYAELLDKSEKIAMGLFSLGLQKDDKLIIAARTNAEIIELLWGCFLLGVIPTILQPPVTFTGFNPAVVKLMNVYEQLGEPYVFMSRDLKESGDLPKEKVKHTDELDLNGGYPNPFLNPHETAFIQFSSGSTGDPKGIMLSHRNFMVNMDAIHHGLGVKTEEVIGNWMPLFHDMGLIGYHLSPIYSEVSQFHTETFDFIMNPGLWLDLLSREHITISGTTNFGLSLVLRHLKRSKNIPDLDLSALKALLNGAEPVTYSIIEDFSNALHPYGFRPEAMMPVYGMAEATLAVTFSPLMQSTVVKAFDSHRLDADGTAVPVDPEDPSARIFTEVGMPVNDIFIRIMDQNDLPLGEGIAGAIQVKGDSVMLGYFRNPEATESAFCGEWLRTGDIGFFSDGRLFISGRHKDILFKNGRNYFANDLESMACRLEGISYGKICFGAVTSKETGQDKVIAFAAGISDEKGLQVFQELRSLLRSNLGITIDELVLIKSNEIPKTSSGKLQRYKLMQRYISGEFSGRIITPAT